MPVPFQRLRSFAVPKLGVCLDSLLALGEHSGSRGGVDLREAGRICGDAGAHQISVGVHPGKGVHRSANLTDMRSGKRVSLKFNLSLRDVRVALESEVRPDWVCLVPVAKKKVSDLRGLKLSQDREEISQAIARLKKRRIQVAAFIEPSERAVKTSFAFGLDAVEINARHLERLGVPGAKNRQQGELRRIGAAARLAKELGLGVQVGSGLDYRNVRAIAALEDRAGVSLIDEFQVGEAVICRAVWVGLGQAVREMVSSLVAP